MMLELMMKHDNADADKGNADEDAKKDFGGPF